MVFFAILVWAVANLLHPVVLSIIWEGSFGLAESIIASIYSLVFSIPSLLISVLVLQGIKQLRCSIMARYIVWLAATPVIVFLNIQCILMLFGGSPSLDPSFMEFITAPAIAALVSSLICGHYFFKRMKEIMMQPENEREVL